MASTAVEDVAATLRVLPGRRRRLLITSSLILGNELMERLAYFSLATDLITRLDMLGATSAQAATATTVWQGACYAVSILGAYVADAWLGRYWTIVAFSCIYLLGLVGVVLCTGVAALNSRVALMAALYVVALGTGGIKANVSTFGADQFDDGDPAEAAAKSRYFNAFYFTINIGALIASLVVVNVQTSVSWLVGYTIPAVAFATAFAVFVAGTPLYTHVAPRGSPFSRLGAVFVAAAAKWRVTPPSDPTLLFESDSGEDEEEEDGWTGPGSPLAAALAKRRAGSAGSSVRLEGGRGWRTVSAGSMGREPLPADAAAAARAGDDSAGAEGGAAPARTPFSTHGTEAGAVPDPEDALARHHDPPFRLPASLVRAALRAERRTSSAGGEAAWLRTAAGGWLGTPRPLSAGIVSLAASSHGGARSERASSRAGSYADAHSRVPGSAAITSAAAAAAAATAAASGVRRRARAAAAAFEAAADAGADADAYIPPPSRRLAHTTYAPWLDKAATPLALYYRAAAEAGVARPRPPGGAPLICCGGGLGPEDAVVPLPTAAPAGGLKLSETTGMTRSGGAPPPLRPIRLPGGGGPSTSPPPRERHLCSVTQTEETKRMLSFLPLCLTTVIFQAVYAQMSSTFVLQGRFMDRIVGGQFDAGGVHTGGFTISSATLSAFNTIAVLVCVPLYDLVVVPLVVRARGRAPTYLQRIGAGLVVSVLTMAIAASLEAWRLAVAARGGPPVSVFALALPYALVGVSEVCVFIGLMEMCYSESPDSMRSLASALQLLTGALGSFLSSAIVAAVEAGGRAYSASGRGWLPDTDEGYQGRLDLFYTLLMAISAANLAFFAYVASGYQYKVLADPSVRAGRGGLAALRAAEAGAGRAGVAGAKEVGAVGAAAAAGRL